MTRGTNKQALADMTDSQLRRHAVELALDVARTANNPNSTMFEIQFAMGTMQGVNREMRLREQARDSVKRWSGSAPASEQDEMVRA